ncbi:uncharacterized protein LOC135489388 isoform X2 [Lineus longissimus]
MEKGRGRGRRLGTKASRPPLEFAGDDEEKVSPEKVVQSKIDAFTVPDDELKSPVQISRKRDDDGDYDPEEDGDDEDDDEVVVVKQRSTGRVLRLAKRHTVDEESIALDVQLLKCGLSKADLLVMSKDDKKEMLKIFQESQQDNEVNQLQRRAFFKEADIRYEDFVLEQGKATENQQSKSDAVSAAQGAPDEEETQAPEDDFMTFGQTLDEDASRKGHDENGEDGSQHGDVEEGGMRNSPDEEETQPYELEQDLLSRMMSKKRMVSVQQVQETSENDEAIPKNKKSKIQDDDSPRPRFHFEFEENEDLPPPSPIPATLVNKRRLKQKKSKRPFLMFAPSSLSPVEYTMKIIQYFDEYFLTLREVQCGSATMLAWGDPVCEGRHMPNSLDVFTCKPVRPAVFQPGKSLFSDDEPAPPKQKTLTNMTIDDAFGFESLDEPKPSNSRADRYEKRKRHRYGEYAVIIEDDDFTRDPDFTFVRKPPPKKGRGKGQGKSSSTNKETDCVRDVAKSPVFDKSTAAGAAHSDDTLPDLNIESDDTPPLPTFHIDSNSIGFEGPAAGQSAPTAITHQRLRAGDDEESDSILKPGKGTTNANTRGVGSTKRGGNIGVGSSKSPEKMDFVEEADSWRSSAGRKRSSFLIDDNVKGRMKLALKTSCENISSSSSRENSQNEDSDKKVNIPAEKLTITRKIIRKIQSIISPATKSQEDRIQEAAVNDLNELPGGDRIVRALDYHSPQASQDLFSNDTQELDDPCPSPTFPGCPPVTFPRGSDVGTDGSKTRIKSVGNIPPGGFVTSKNEPNSEFDEPLWNLQGQDPDDALRNYPDKSDAKRTARPNRGARNKPTSQDVNDNVSAWRTRVELSDDGDPVQVQHKRPPVGRRKTAAGSASDKTRREEVGENVMEAGSSRRRLIRPPQKKRKMEAEAIAVLESEEEEEDPVPQIVEPQVDCPLCGDPYPQSRIEVHASECDGISQKNDKRLTRSSANTPERKKYPDRLQHTSRPRNQQADVRHREREAARFSSSDSDSDDPGHPLPPASLYGINTSVIPDHAPKEDLFDMARQMAVPRRARKPKPVVDGEACYICDGMFKKGKEYEEHVNRCMDAQQEQQRRIMQSFSKERSQSVDNEDGGDEPGQSGHE